MFFLVFFFWGDFGVIGEFIVIGNILYPLSFGKGGKVPPCFILYHLSFSTPWRAHATRSLLC